MPTSEATFSLLLAGDAMVVRPWSQDTDPAFHRLVETIRAADVAITNLETVIHEFKGYPQADSGGTYMHTPPVVARELRWAGFDLVANANNHAFDYGEIGVLETVTHVREAGLEIAGCGEDLHAARSPRYVQASGCEVAVVAMASTFVRYGKASRSRADVRGRPGVNPLAISPVERGIVVPSRWAATARALGTRLGLRVREGESFRFFNGRELSPHDRAANLDAISRAAERAAFVVASIHAHRQGAWLERFAAEAIDRGAGAVFVHGPHRVGPIVLHRGRPVFYCLGDFVHEIEHIERWPADEYEKWGLGDDATPAELVAASKRRNDRESARREAYEGVVATLFVSRGRAERIRLDPIDLRFDADRDTRGRPRLADPDTGRRIIADVAEQSKQHGTGVRYDAAANCGEVECTYRS